MRLPKHIVKHDQQTHLELICQRCNGSLELWTDNREWREKHIESFVEYHKNCKLCEGGVCEVR